MFILSNLMRNCMPNKQIPSFEDMDIEHVSVREARERFAPLLTSVATASERVILTRHKKPWVAIVGVDDLNELVKLDNEKLSAFASRHRESVNDVTNEHSASRDEAASILETEETDDFIDWPSERERELEAKVDELELEIQKLEKEKYFLEGKIEGLEDKNSVPHVVQVGYVPARRRGVRNQTGGTGVVGSFARGVRTSHLASHVKNVKTSEK